MNLPHWIEKAPENVRSAIQYRHYPKGTHILYPDDENSHLFLLLDGLAEVYQYTPGGMFISLFRYGENSCFGEIELFCPSRMALGILAVKDCEIAMLTKELSLSWATQDKTFCAFLLEEMAFKIAENSDAYIRSSSLTLKERLLYCLYRHSQSGTLDMLTKDNAASEICAPTRSLNRAIAECQRAQLIHYDKHRFYILDMNALKKIVVDL